MARPRLVGPVRNADTMKPDVLERIFSMTGYVVKWWRIATMLPVILVLGIGLYLRFDGFLR